MDQLRQHGHTHLVEIIEHAQWIRNKAVLLTHFSSRYSIEDIRQAVDISPLRRVESGHLSPDHWCP